MVMDDKEFKRLKIHTVVSAILGLWIVYISQFDDPGTLGGLIVLRTVGGMNLMAAIIGVLTMMWVYRLRGKKNDPV